MEIILAALASRYGCSQIAMRSSLMQLCLQSAWDCLERALTSSPFAMRLFARSRIRSSKGLSSENVPGWPCSQRNTIVSPCIASPSPLGVSWGRHGDAWLWKGYFQARWGDASKDRYISIANLLFAGCQDTMRRQSGSTRQAKHLPKHHSALWCRQTD